MKPSKNLNDLSDYLSNTLKLKIEIFGVVPHQLTLIATIYGDWK